MEGRVGGRKVGGGRRGEEIRKGIWEGRKKGGKEEGGREGRERGRKGEVSCFHISMADKSILSCISFFFFFLR
jgi:hypothetical protein